MPASQDRIDQLIEQVWQITRGDKFCLADDKGKRRHHASYPVGVAVIGLTLEKTRRFRKPTLEIEIDEPVVDTLPDVGIWFEPDDLVGPILMKKSTYLFKPIGFLRKYALEKAGTSFWASYQGEAYDYEPDSSVFIEERTGVDDSERSRQIELLNRLHDGPDLSQAECEYLMRLTGLFEYGVAVPYVLAL